MLCLNWKIPDFKIEDGGIYLEDNISSYMIIKGNKYLSS